MSQISRDDPRYEHDRLVRRLMERAVGFPAVLREELGDMTPFRERFAGTPEISGDELVSWAWEFPVSSVRDFLLAVRRALKQARDDDWRRAGVALYRLGTMRLIQLKPRIAGVGNRVLAVPANARTIYETVAQAVAGGKIDAETAPGVYEVHVPASGERPENAAMRSLALAMEPFNEDALDQAQDLTGSEGVRALILGRFESHRDVDRDTVGVVIHGLGPGVDGEPPRAALVLAELVGPGRVSVQHTNPAGGPDVEVLGDMTFATLQRFHAEFERELVLTREREHQGGKPSMAGKGDTIINTHGGPVTLVQDGDINSATATGPGAVAHAGRQQSGDFEELARIVRDLVEEARLTAQPVPIEVTHLEVELRKPEPDKGIVRRGLERLKEIGGGIEGAGKIADLVAKAAPIGTAILAAWAR